MATIPRLEPELEIRALPEPEGYGISLQGLLPYQQAFIDQMGVPEAIVTGGNRHSRELTASEILAAEYRSIDRRAYWTRLQQQLILADSLRPGPSFTLTAEQVANLPDDLKAKIKKPPEPVVSIKSPYEFAPPPGTRRFA